MSKKFDSPSWSEYGVPVSCSFTLITLQGLDLITLSALEEGCLTPWQSNDFSVFP